MTLRGRVRVRLPPRFGALPCYIDDGCFVYRFLRNRAAAIFESLSASEAGASASTGAARRSAVREEPGHPVAASPVPTLSKNGTRLSVSGNKGVLRTMVSKRTFAYFSSVRKVGRRRHNTIQHTVGYRQKEPSRVSGTNIACPPPKGTT